MEQGQVNALPSDEAKLSMRKIAPGFKPAPSKVLGSFQLNNSTILMRKESQFLLVQLHSIPVGFQV